MLTVPSGSISNRCFGVVDCRPDRTYCPGLPCDSRTKKSPSCFNRASEACRLIEAWNHCSVNNCERCTSADNENGSRIKITKNIGKQVFPNWNDDIASFRPKIPNYPPLELSAWKPMCCSINTYAYRIHLWLSVVVCYHSHQMSCHSHSLALMVDYSNQSNYCSIALEASVFIKSIENLIRLILSS